MELLDVLVGLLRVLGGFPYLDDKAEGGKAWRARAIDDHERALSKAPKEPRRFRESRPWVWWSRLMYVFILAYMAEYFWETHRGIRMVIQTDTMQAANKVNDTLKLVVLLSLFSYVVWNKSPALELVMELQKVPRCCHGSPRTLQRHLLMTLAMVVFTASHVIILENYVSRIFFKPTLVGATDIFETVMYLPMISFTMCFYYGAICRISDTYDDIIWSLSELRDSGSNTTRVPASPPGLHRKSNPLLSPVSAAKVPTEDPLADVSYKPESEFFKEQLLRGSITRLTQLHRLQRLLHQYLGFPIAATLLTTVIASILSFFYYSFWVIMDVRIKVLSASYTVISLLPSLVLCNVPPLLQERVCAWNFDYLYHYYYL